MPEAKEQMPFEQVQTKKRGRFPSWVLAALIAIFIGLLYFNSLGNQFTNWDDGMIYQNLTIRDLTWKGILNLFTPQRANTYQPVRMLSYAVDYRFWRLNPLGFHIANTLYYALTCIMVFLTLMKLSSHLRSEEAYDSHFRVGFFGSFLFAALPVHVEAVAWLSARKEVLQGFFFFLAFYLYLLAKEKEQKRKWALLSLVLISILLAILSKPSAVVFPAVLLVYEISVRKNGWMEFVKRHWTFFLISALVSLFFIAILMKVMLDAGGVKAYRGGNPFNNFLLSFYVFINNIKLLIFTINYSAAYAMKIPTPVLSPPVLLAIVDTLLLAAVSLWSLKKTRVLFFSFFFFGVTLLPYLNIIPISTLVADRYVFIASFSYCFLLGVAFDRFYRFKARRFSMDFFKVLSTAVFLLLLSGYSFMTIQQNRIWENSYTLWADAVEKQPDSNTANSLMGVVFMELGMNEEALKHLHQAVQLFPYDYESRNNLGIVYGRLNEPEKALQELLVADQLKPEQFAIRVNLALHFERQREYDKAEKILKELIAKHPQNANLYYRLGLLYKTMENYESAIAQFTRSTQLAPDIINPYEELGNIYLHHFKDTEKAKFYYSRGIEAAPKARVQVEMLRRIVQDLESQESVGIPGRKTFPEVLDPLTAP
jgi:tetratricopeptide (TPR) repeat protein